MANSSHGEEKTVSYQSKHMACVIGLIPGGCVTCVTKNTLTIVAQTAAAAAAGSSLTVLPDHILQTVKSLGS